MNPLVLDNDNPVDVFAALSHERALFINGDIDEDITSEICASLLSKDLENNKQINLFINSEGGYVQNILSIYDTMKMIKSPIRTIVLGECAYEAVLIAAAGTKGMRFVTKNSHYVLSKLFHDGFQHSDITDAKINLEFMNLKNESYLKSLSECIDKKPKDVKKLIENKKYLFPEEAINLGFADSIIKEANEKQ